MSKELNRIKKLSGIEQNSKINQFEFNKSQQVLEFLSNMSRDLSKEQKNLLVEKLKKNLSIK